MTLASRTKKILHAAITGFTGGLLYFGSTVLTTGITEKKALLAAVFGILVGSVGRGVGAVLAGIEHPDGKGA
jgi:tetrahydromethanopterin S-methyltransferase subunit E